MTMLRKKGTDWSRALDALLDTQIEVVPKDFLSSHQVAQQFGLSVEQTQKFITMMKRNSVIEAKSFRIKTNGKYGIVKAVPHYRLIKKPSASK